MKKSILVCCVLAASSVHAAEQDAGDWYGSISSGFLWAGGDANFVGPTDSLYGGSPQFDMDDGNSYSIAIGRRVNSSWRVEAELAFLNPETDTGPVNGFDDRADDVFVLDADIGSTVLMLNGVYDFDTPSDRFRPYAKVGLGIARNEAKGSMQVEHNSEIWDGTPNEGETIVDEFPSSYETDLAWNLGLGVRTRLSDRFMLSLEYAYVDLGSTESGMSENEDALTFDDLSVQRLQLGLDFAF